MLRHWERHIEWLEYRHTRGAVNTNARHGSKELRYMGRSHHKRRCPSMTTGRSNTQNNAGCLCGRNCGYATPGATEKIIETDTGVSGTLAVPP